MPGTEGANADGRKSSQKTWAADLTDFSGFIKNNPLESAQSVALFL